MAYFTKTMLEESDYEAKQYEELLQAKTISDAESFNIFLSHSYKDRKYIRKLKEYIENNFSMTCYVDWITEPKTLDRNNVNRKSAEQLRRRMRQSQSLIFCTSENSPDSKWMPWELGYFDGYKKGRVAILPIVDEGASFQRQEYLSLYPYIDLAGVKDGTSKSLWVNESDSEYVSFSKWLLEEEPPKRS
jgi:hypothetical protein